ncbi:MAG: hypothetical protein J7J38_03410 [Candidatus Aenigmarchaeota archaeon]|nr:hypothetical protein [Candidatus Aenigmarchaeota archaeon]
MLKVTSSQEGRERKGPEIEGNPLMRFCLANPEVGYPIIAILTTIWVMGYLYLRTRKPKYALVLPVFL